MALPSSPPISLNQIKTEFGATGTRSITAFYRGGAFVPNIPANSSVPTSGAISVLDFLGATAYIPLDGNRGSISEIVFLNEPAPPTYVVLAEVTAGASGGTGSYTYQWSVRSGGASIQGSSTASTTRIGATVAKNSTVTGVVRCTISDGVTSINIDRNYSLAYSSDL